MTTTTTKNKAQTATLSREAAESLTAEIRAAGKNVVKFRRELIRLVDEAREGNAHKVMGYASWTAYVADLFHAEQDGFRGMAAADREYLTAFLAGEGMSSRAIARALGISQSTASRMVKAAESDGKVDAERKVTRTDGRKVKASKAGKNGGTRKGKGKGKPAAGKDANKGEVNVRTAKTQTLTDTLSLILAELAHRASDGDTSAASAMRDLPGMLAMWEDVTGPAA